MKKYWIITYGCQMNKSDSERIAAVLEKIGCLPATNISEADLILINACSVRQSAVDRVWGQTKKISKLKSQKSNLISILTGCVLNEDRKKFKDRFDLILNIKDLPRLPKILGIKIKKIEDDYLQIKPKYETNFRAYIPIIIGCNNFCSYCVVPYVRGKEISRPAEEIICEIKNLVNRGYKDIWLLGENVNSYFWNGINFPQLLKLVNDIPGKFWVHFISPHPKDFSDELIEVIVNSEKVGKYINLPVQSGDDEILKKMNRPYTVNHYKHLVKKIRKKIPGVCLSTDVIVGFPGETKKQFQNTVKLFKEIKFDMAYISQYSPRPQTAASKLKDNVSHQEKERREKYLTEILKKTALANNKKYIGKEIEVLAEEKKNEFLIGKTKTYKTIKFEGSKNLIGQFVNVKIVDALPWGLRGKLLK